MSMLNKPDKNELITSQFEKELAALALQGYSIFKKFLKSKRDLQEICIKCGSSDIFTTWCNINHAENLKFPVSPHLHHGPAESLHKACGICGYSFLKPVLKSGEPR